MRRIGYVITFGLIITGIIFSQIDLIPANSESLDPRLVGIKVNGSRTVELVFDPALSGLQDVVPVQINVLDSQGGIYLPSEEIEIEKIELTGRNRVVRVILAEKLQDRMYRVNITSQIINVAQTSRLDFRGKTYDTLNPHGYWTAAEAQCNLCHVTHEGNGEGILAKNRVEEACLMCHQGQEGVKEINTDNDNPHLLNFDCANCHDPHLPGLQNGNYLLSLRDRETGKVVGPGPQLCFSCHDVNWKQYYDTDVIPGTNRIEGRHSLLWSEAKSFSCLMCHSLHNPQELNNSLCFSCHHQDSWNYPDALPFPGRAAYEAVIDGRSRHGNLDCISCHQVHGSPYEIQLRQPVNELCVECHQGYRYRITVGEETRVKPLAGCKSCHNPHGSDTNHNNSYLLSDDLNLRSGETQLMKMSKGVLGERQTCFGCHRAYDEDTEKTVEGFDMTPLSDNPDSEGQHFLNPAEEPQSCLHCHSIENQFHSN